MNKSLWSILQCPECKGSLKFEHNKVVCTKCKNFYQQNNGKIIFLKKFHELEDDVEESFKSKLVRNPMFSKLRKVHHYLGPPDTTYEKKEYINYQTVPFPLANLLKSSKKKKLVLNIGSSSKKIYPDTINLDIGPYENVDVVADGKILPFKDNSLDIVLIEMVLEHVDEPEKVIAEAHRVLKTNGKIYVSIPFMFVFHGSPGDFNRYTLHGLRRRLQIAGFKIKNSGILSGPSSTLSQVLRYYLALVFSFNNSFLFSLFLNFFGWITFPIKYLDALFNNYKMAHLIASTIYALGEK